MGIDLGVEPKIVVGPFPPKWMVKIMENPIKMDDLGVFPYFWKWFQIFLEFSPRKLGKINPIWLKHIFQMGGKKPPSRSFSIFLVGKGGSRQRILVRSSSCYTIVSPCFQALVLWIPWFFFTNGECQHCHSFSTGNAMEFRGVSFLVHPIVKFLTVLYCSMENIYIYITLSSRAYILIYSKNRSLN